MWSGSVARYLPTAEPKGAFVAARRAEFDNFRAGLSWALGGNGDGGIAVALLGYASPMAALAASRTESEAWLATLTQRLGTAALSPRQVALRCSAALVWGLMTTLGAQAPRFSHGVSAVAMG
jgi:hypothetical protein